MCSLKSTFLYSPGYQGIRLAGHHLEDPIEEGELKRFKSRVLLWISIVMFAPSSIAVMISRGQRTTTGSSFLSDTWAVILIAIALLSAAAIAVLTRDSGKPRSDD